MSLAATQDYQPHESLMVPDGGIAAFLNATEGDWATDDIPHTGIAQVKHVADRLAEYGRYEDEFMVHAAEGETVVPLEVLNANPQLKDNLFKQMEAMGLEPERYVVGNELNSLNPVTGQPEFFLKKLFKGVKKLVKKVVKVIKKAVPIVLPIALAMTPLGPIFGAAMGSGINTLAAGGNLKDALKAGVKAGALGGFASGIAGGVGSLRAGNTFAEGFKSSVGSAAGGIGERFKQFASPGRVSEAGGTYFGDPTRAIKSPLEQQGIANTQVMQEQLTSDINARMNPQVINETRLANQQSLPGQQGRGVVTVTDLPPRDPLAITYDPNRQVSANFVTPTTDRINMNVPGTGNIPTSNVDPASFFKDVPLPGADAAAAKAAERTFLQKTGDLMFRGGKPPVTVEQELAQQFTSANQYLDAARNAGLDVTTPAVQAGAQKFGEQAVAAMGPSRLARFGPSAALASGIAAGTGFFDAPETEETETESMLSGEELLAQDPEKYMIRYPTALPTYSLSDVTVPGYGIGYAAGGNVEPSQFPRRDGAIAGPGTGTSDDVPAMLSDGEFVMTAKAVRGAGNGNRQNGMQTMYNLMRNFEAAR